MMNQQLIAYISPPLHLGILNNKYLYYLTVEGKYYLFTNGLSVSHTHTKAILSQLGLIKVVNINPSILGHVHKTNEVEVFPVSTDNHRFCK